MDNELRKLKKTKMQQLYPIACDIICLIFFPVSGLVFMIMWIIDDIKYLHKINMAIKKEKIKNLLFKDTLIVRDENGYIKDIKL